MSIADVRKGMGSKGKYEGSCAGNPNMGGEMSTNPKIDNQDDEQGFTDNSGHAINRMKKGK